MTERHTACGSPFLNVQDLCPRVGQAARSHASPRLFHGFTRTSTGHEHNVDRGCSERWVLPREQETGEVPESV